MQNGIAYLAGGPHDAYLADIHVTIKDHADKTVVDTVADGPIMLVKVPARVPLGEGMNR